MIEFAPWPKIARLNRDIVITEKIDGTNAAIHVDMEWPELTVAAQSRTRMITAAEDNHGFARWVRDNAIDLAAALGPGVHFGEWWGSGIQRAYGLTKGEKRFSLFNTHRWGDIEKTSEGLLYSVPVLYSGPFNQEAIDDCIDGLRSDGSAASPGFGKPEGVVIFHTAANLMFKVTLEKDEAPKTLAVAS